MARSTEVLAVCAVSPRDYRGSTDFLFVPAACATPTSRSYRSRPWRIARATAAARSETSNFS